MVAMDTAFTHLLAMLCDIADPRRAEGKLYGLPHVFLFSILAVMAGANSYRAIHSFIDVHLHRLKQTWEDLIPLAAFLPSPSSSCRLRELYRRRIDGGNNRCHQQCDSFSLGRPSTKRVGPEISRCFVARAWSTSRRGAGYPHPASM